MNGNTGEADSIRRTWESDILPALSEFTRIPCVSSAFDAQWEASGHLDEAARQLADWCTRRPIPGVSAEVVRIPGRTPVVIVEIPATTSSAGTSSAGTVLMYGHLDKQPPLGEWREGLEPYLAVRDGDVLYGRGTADDGYAVFSAIAAVEALAEGSREHPRVVILIEGSEESGSPDLDAYLAELADRIGRPGLVICLDSGCLDYTRIWYTTSLRGNLVATLRVQVLHEGVHSGLAGGVVPTSFRLLRSLVSRIEDQDTGKIIPAWLDSPTSDTFRRQLERLADLKSTGSSGRTVTFPIVPGLAISPNPLSDRAWSPSLSVVGIDGIPDLAHAGNVLRPYSTAKLSLRLPPPIDAAAAADRLVELLTADPPAGASVTVVIESAADGWVAPEVLPWVVGALERASARTFGNPPEPYGEGGTIPFLATLGRRFPTAQVVALGVLGPGSNAHGPNEALHLPMARAVTDAAAELLAAAVLPSPAEVTTPAPELSSP